MTREHLQPPHRLGAKPDGDWSPEVRLELEKDSFRVGTSPMKIFTGLVTTVFLALAVLVALGVV
jgi:hypothetical protein